MQPPAPVDTPVKDWTNHEWIMPEKLIKEPTDLDKWKHSKSYEEYMTFVGKLQEKVESKPISATKSSPKFESFLQFLDSLMKLVDDVPPIQQKMRFGNTAYKDWHKRAMAVERASCRWVKSSSRSCCQHTCRVQRPSSWSTSRTPSARM